MTREEILKHLDGYEYVMYGNDHVVVELGEGEELVDDVPPEFFDEFLAHYAETIKDGRRVAVIQLSAPYEDEEDAASSMSFCGCWAG